LISSQINGDIDKVIERYAAQMANVTLEPKQYIRDNTPRFF